MSISRHYRPYLFDREYLISALTAILFLLIGLVVNFYAGSYATRSASNSVTDLILSNIRVYDVDWFFVYGAVIFWLFVGLVCVLRPWTIPFTLKSIALFVLVCSVFITLTHIGPYPTQVEVNSYIMSWFTFGGDLFFSAHVGLPFLMALIFWQKRSLRIFFIFAAIIFSFVVLLAHLHYSIDVLGAFFITYTIFHLSEMFFKKDRRLFNSGLIAVS